MKELIRHILKEETLKKFDRKLANRGRHSDSLEKLTINFIGEDKICDVIAVFSESIYVVMVLYNGGSRYNLDIELQKFLKSIIPIKIFTMIADTRCGNETINNIESLQEETSRYNKIKSMIDDFGVLNTIKALGSYTRFKKMYGENLTKDEKVVLIRELVKEYGEDGDYIDVMPYDIFVDIDNNQTDSRDYTTEVIYVNRGGYFNFRQYTYDDELEDYDWEDYHNGNEYLFVLSESELENIIRVIFERVINK